MTAIEKRRASALWEKLSPAGGAAALLLYKDENIRYFSGFCGADSTLLLLPDAQVLLTDGRYMEQAERECPGCTCVCCSRAYPVEQALAERLTEVETLYVEGAVLSYDGFQALQAALPGKKLLSCGNAPEQVRAVKDEMELSAMRRAAQIADTAYCSVLEGVHAGQCERDIANELLYAMRALGAEGESFATIVAAGENSSLPHALAGSRRLREGDLLLIDMGAKYQGYCSDMTRTVCLGKIADWQRELYVRVEAAQKAVLARLAAGMRGAEADAIARDMFTKAGCAEQFCHSLGHGVGLEIHELPLLSPSAAEEALVPGNVVTVEPGLYLPGKGGVRIEDSVLIREDGIEILNHAPKGLFAI